MIKRNYIALIGIITSLLLIAAGIYRNEVSTVFNKSVRICLECIGIG